MRLVKSLRMHATTTSLWGFPFALSRGAETKCRIILSIHVESLGTTNLWIHMDGQDEQDQQKAIVTTPIRVHDPAHCDARNDRRRA